MSIPNIQSMMRRQAAQLLASSQTNASTVTMHWREQVIPAGYDPNDESSGSISDTAHSMEFRAFVHHVDHRTSAYQRFMELETGTVILDYLDDLALDGKRDIRFEINGRFYTQKPLGKELLEMWTAEGSEFGGFMRTTALMPLK